MLGLQFNKQSWPLAQHQEDSWRELDCFTSHLRGIFTSDFDKWSCPGSILLWIIFMNTKCHACIIPNQFMNLKMLIFKHCFESLVRIWDGHVLLLLLLFIFITSIFYCWFNEVILRSDNYCNSKQSSMNRKCFCSAKDIKGLVFVYPSTLFLYHDKKS